MAFSSCSAAFITLLLSLINVIYAGSLPAFCHNEEVNTSANWSRDVTGAEPGLGYCRAFREKA